MSTSNDTQQKIAEWADETFGESTVENMVRRFDQELREFFEGDPIAEAPDLVICLFRLMHIAGRDLMTDVLAKMEVNYKREWVRDGQGQGQHVGSVGQKGVFEELLELRRYCD